MRCLYFNLFLFYRRVVFGETIGWILNAQNYNFFQKSTMFLIFRR